MKIILGGYILICWLLVKFKVINKTLGNMIAMGLGGLFLVFMVLTLTRYLAFLDLTHSAMVRAPHVILNTPAGGEIEKIYVTHNQIVKAGDPIYRYKTDRYEIEMKSQIAERARLQTQLAKLERDLARLKQLRGDIVSEAEYDAKEAEIRGQRDMVVKAQQAIADLQWKVDRAVIVAPTDGQVTIQYTAEGQYFPELRPASIQMFTNKKFIEVRIPDQVYGYIKPNAFAEFYVNAYPGKIFRARVHSVGGSTGEAQGILFGGIPQGVGERVAIGSMGIGRLVILEFNEPPGINIPVGSTGAVWIAAEKPIHFLGFLDAVIGVLLRFGAAEAYLKAW